MRPDYRSLPCGALLAVVSLAAAAATMPIVLAQAAQAPVRPPSAPNAAAGSSELQRGKAVFDETAFDAAIDVARIRVPNGHAELAAELAGRPSRTQHDRTT